MSLSSHPWLADHAIGGTVPGPGHPVPGTRGHRGRAAGARHRGGTHLQAPLVLPRQTAAQLRLTVDRADARGDRRFTVYARTGEQWTAHAAGLLTSAVPAPGVALD
ncbi:hypothetical protein [Streptomyces sp. KL116D]|uniref:hypothetical protein n=1 Tax=Streptomyces sp. KL116D TaxID=3045152 RepID=UPI0035576005